MGDTTRFGFREPYIKDIVLSNFSIAIQGSEGARTLSKLRRIALDRLRRAMAQVTNNAIRSGNRKLVLTHGYRCSSNTFAHASFAAAH